MDDPVTEVATARLAKRLTQRELALRSRVSLPYIKIIDRGYVPLTAVRKRIATALGSTEEALWPQLFTEEYLAYGRKR